MASWFYASEGKQQGPYPEGQFRDLIAQGVVRAETLVWSEGMAGWQKAAEIPGLMTAGGAPPIIPVPGPPMMGGGYGGSAAGGPLSIDFGIWDFVWRSIVYALGAIFLIPIPWLLTWYVKWLVSCVQVPGRPNLSFEGSAMTLVPWFFGAIVLLAVIALIDFHWVVLPAYLIIFVLDWLLIKWLIANLASNGQRLGLSFTGSPWALVGWILLAGLASITIVGWAWVYAAAFRWFCRNIQGTRHEVIFKGTGLEILWRTIVVALASSFIIPIPWMYRWMWRWKASQTVLAPRGTMAGM
jgi:hypothetical protein